MPTRVPAIVAPASGRDGTRTPEYHVCLEPGCGELTEHRRCLLHAPQRATTAQRGYGAAWQSISTRYRSEHPRCVMCGRPSEVVDHILSRRDGGSDDASNLRALCWSCHSRRTAIDQSGWGSGS